MVKILMEKKYFKPQTKGPVYNLFYYYFNITIVKKKKAYLGIIYAKFS